ncbi:3-dehydroquinate synthase [Lachnoclostridium sp. MSJ-17]|uniref:3-dehydroquinate synthase n=1 Tax=Lachnoclostridium sp. MSJ-17 TaxID=2841516 RepID=UPI001C11BBA6|nr:3-dehydroquinate synthase [Lachnoclostridium sp. MSJ-17]MBU5462841.1 3-dehydroquinate synthase [Lachnoclostridium sp. MSJ-17]
MRTVHVSTGKPYDIYIERGLLDKTGEYVKSLSRAERAVLVTDTNVAPLYKWKVLNSLSAAGIEVTTHVFQAGEASKHLGTVSDMYKTLADAHITRKDLIVALGGGVCGDMAGFAAATYLRGIDFIQLPTSLLAQVDSSVGGKTGVDLPQGKNLVGAFHQPIAVLIDPDTLNTLPDRFITDGMGEVIKYGCIKDARFFEFLENENALDHIEDVIETCVSIKRDVVSRDEREKGERMLLNFGHTLGHAIEKLYNFSGISHGMAVAIGMVMLAKAGEKHGITAQGSADRIAALCEKYSLPTTESFTFAELAQAARSDKKSAGDSINLVLLREIGDSFTQKIELDKLEEFIAAE